MKERDRRGIAFPLPLGTISLIVLFGKKWKQEKKQGGTGPRIPYRTLVGRFGPQVLKILDDIPEKIVLNMAKTPEIILD